MLLIPNKETIYHVALTGYPSSGKSEVARVLHDKAGYGHVSTDIIIDDMLNGKSIFQLTEEDVNLISSETHTRKHLYLRNGKNVATDNCPRNNALRKLTVHISPLLGEYLRESNKQLARYLIVLNTNMKELIRRNENRGRTDEPSYRMFEWFKNEWEEPPDRFVDDIGIVPVIQYENNTRRDQQLILKDLEKRLDVNLFD